MFVPTCRHCLFLSLVLNALAMAAAASDAAGQSSLLSDWTVVQVPDVWRKVPTGRLAPIDGYSWYRTAVRVPDAWSGHDLILAVEALDDVRSAWVNGSVVGVNGTFPPHFRSGLGQRGRFPVPAELIRPGTVQCIAIRVYQSDPRLNFNVAPPVLLDPQRMEAIRMNGPWLYRPGDDVQWSCPESSPVPDGLIFSKVDAVDDVEEYVAWREGDRPPLSPREAAAAFRVPEDLKIDLVLSEPQVTQPLFMTWDDSGRLWVMEYRQYPDPAGLTVVSRDIYLRTVYDKVPEPPPRGVPGRDRISVHEDTDGDGVPDHHWVFADGLNIATSLAIGRGGVFVTNPPYLLFYPDEDADGHPDGDPEVLLEGFGLQDTHSVINSLTFGPDGWLYGCQGSTVTAQVRRPGSGDPPVSTVGQQIWRYHPQQKRFEVFAEGGGNAFGLEIDAFGRIFSGHNGGNTRGFHYVQGGYYRKGFAKHGELSNPFAFGFFEAMLHHDVPRFTHDFIIYQADRLPERYRGRLLGVEPLQGQVVLCDVEPYQSSLRTRDVERIVQTDDPWFRPVNIAVGPDGHVYVADMYEQRIDHSSHYAGRVDRSNGRIWKLSPRAESRPAEPFDGPLLNMLTSTSRWHRMTAVRLLGDHPDASLIPDLMRQIRNTRGEAAVATLWGLHAVGGLTRDRATECLQHETPFVRVWTIRLMTDGGQVNAEWLPHLIRSAQSDPSIHVRKQLAASARRLPAEWGIPLIRALLSHDEDAQDIHQPLMLWWAMEAHVGSESGRQQIVSRLLPDERIWRHALMRDHLAERLMKRLILSGSADDMRAAAVLLKQCPDAELTGRLLAALEASLVGIPLATIPSELPEAIETAGGGSVALQLRQRRPQAIRTALQVVADPSADPVQRRQFAEIFGDLRLEESVSVLLKTVNGQTPVPVLESVLGALSAFSDPVIGRTVAAQISDLPESVRPAAASLLASRPAWSEAVLQAVIDGQVPAELLPDAVLRRMLLHDSAFIRQTIARQWGAVRGSTTEDMQAEMRRVRSVLKSGAGNPRQGKRHYMKHCGRCHRLFGEGGQIGPDLTPFQRSDLDRLLQNIINPDLEIREGFDNYLVVTADGRVASGFLAAQDERLIVLRSPEGISQTFFREELDEMTVVPESVMPKGLLRALPDQEIRDLFAYLRSSQPVNY